jgi:hypothetical protein
VAQPASEPPEGWLDGWELPYLTALVILPALRHDVHTCTRLGLPSTIARTLWMLGFQRRLVRRCEWLMLIPKDGRLPQTSQTAAIGNHTSLCRDSPVSTGSPG